MSRVDRVSQVARGIEKAILSGELAPGDVIPSERQISAQMKVSRSVVREALGRLTSLGLVHSVHGSGTRVAVPNSQQVKLGYERLLRGSQYGLDDVSAVRLPLETTIVRLAAKHRTDAQLLRLQQTQQVLGNPRRSLDAHVKADLEFHATLAEASGNPVFAIVLAPIQELLMDSRRRTLGQYGAAIAYRHHARILDAVAARDARAAVDAMTEHLQTNFEHLSRPARRIGKSGKS